MTTDNTRSIIDDIHLDYASDALGRQAQVSFLTALAEKTWKTSPAALLSERLLIPGDILKSTLSETRARVFTPDGEQVLKDLKTRIGEKAASEVFIIAYTTYATVKETLEQMDNKNLPPKAILMLLKNQGFGNSSEIPLRHVCNAVSGAARTRAALEVIIREQSLTREQLKELISMPTGSDGLWPEEKL